MKKVLVTVPFNENQLKELKSVGNDLDFIFANANEVTDSDIESVSAVIGNVDVKLLKDKTNLEWVQLNSSGADAYAAPGAVPESTVLTCATGAYGVAISEYMVGMLMVMMKRIPGYLDCQKEGSWKDLGPVETPFGKRVLLVGCGNIGLEFAKRMKAFGCTLVGVRRRADNCPAELDEVYPTEQLKEQVANADVIALSLPGTSKSFHLFDKEMLMACKEGAYLMNVGRGNVIDTKALQDKEVYERFGGIWLDVCETEPLPEGDALYHIPGLLLTPHITGGFHLQKTVDNIFDICMNNLKAWCGDGQYKHVVDREAGYSLG